MVIPHQSKSKLGVRKRESHVTKLRKICREAGIFIRSNRELEGCKTDAHIVRRIKQILEKHGMKGRPNMKKAKKIRLKKEAAELDTDNIIRSESRPKRRVNSLFSRNSPSRMKDFTPPRVKFGHLKDIIESEESD
ncbi:uncharacterized protein LOC132554729 [Ylistrum balloti]|uniref:uncharacterized protein LOC132554729 n=1 Tax=Ylistrum balloti TaxID=509963 RepID=UPI0029058EC6|nr:uncharacterized protein LOC132554729 [Ylistrum balloti]